MHPCKLSAAVYRVTYTRGRQWKLRIYGPRNDAEMGHKKYIGVAPDGCQRGTLTAIARDTLRQDLDPDATAARIQHNIDDIARGRIHNKKDA